tara:strand:- start:266 stop:1450 length:1185 start_codon:yes stop_codon:yes gene_type:complete
MNQVNKNLHLFSSDEGFTLLELTAVVVILGLLGSLGIGNITRRMKLSKIDQASTLLSNSLVECLQITRAGTDPTTVGPPTSVIDNNSLESSGYKIKTSKDKCADFFITPKSSDDKVLFEMGYQITADNQVTKIATPADSESSLIRCKRWGGANCGATEEQKAAWAAAAALAAKKKQCNDNFYSWLSDTPPNGGIGSFNRWNENTNDCDLLTFAFEGAIVANQAAVDAAQEAKLGAICNSKVLDQKPLETTGITQLSECGNKTFYFCLGDDKQTEAAMDSCILQSQEQVCIANREKARQNNFNGKYGPFEGPGACGQIHWMCNKVQLTNEAAYNESSCSAASQEKDQQEAKAQECLKKVSSSMKFTVKAWCKYLGNGLPSWSGCSSSGYLGCMGE